MKAIAITAAAQADGNVDALQEIEIEKPVAHGHDLLVQVKAISVNPVDTKVRAGFNADKPRILGWMQWALWPKWVTRSRCLSQATPCGTPER